MTETDQGLVDDPGDEDAVEATEEETAPVDDDGDVADAPPKNDEVVEDETES